MQSNQRAKWFFDGRLGPSVELRALDIASRMAPGSAAFGHFAPQNRYFVRLTLSVFLAYWDARDPSHRVLQYRESVAARA